MAPRILKNDPSDLEFEFEIPDKADIVPGDTVRIGLKGNTITVNFLTRATVRRWFFNWFLTAPRQAWKKWRTRRPAARMVEWKAMRDALADQINRNQPVFDRDRQRILRDLAIAASKAAFYEERVEH